MQRRDPGKPEDDDGDDSDPMSEDDESDEGDGDDVGDDDGNGGGTTKVAGISPGAVAAASAGAKAGPKTGAFLPPLEVELQMQQLWKREGEALDLVFSSGRKRRDRPDAEGGTSGAATPGGDAHGGGGGGDGGVRDGYRLFFVRAVAVPPPRFRPPMHMGDMVAEHPQNGYLTKVRALTLFLLLDRNR